MISILYVIKSAEPFCVDRRREEIFQGRCVEGEI